MFPSDQKRLKDGIHLGGREKRKKIRQKHTGLTAPAGFLLSLRVSSATMTCFNIGLTWFVGSAGWDRNGYYGWLHGSTFVSFWDCI